MRICMSNRSVVRWFGLVLDGLLAPVKVHFFHCYIRRFVVGRNHRRNHRKGWIPFPKLTWRTEFENRLAIHGDNGCVTELFHITQTPEAEYQSIGSDAWYAADDTKGWFEHQHRISDYLKAGGRLESIKTHLETMIGQVSGFNEIRARIVTKPGINWHTDVLITATSEKRTTIVIVR